MTLEQKTSKIFLWYHCFHPTQVWWWLDICFGYNLHRCVSQQWGVVCVCFFMLLATYTGESVSNEVWGVFTWQIIHHPQCSPSVLSVTKMESWSMQSSSLLSSPKHLHTLRHCPHTYLHQCVRCTAVINPCTETLCQKHCIFIQYLSTHGHLHQCVRNTGSLYSICPHTYLHQCVRRTAVHPCTETLCQKHCSISIHWYHVYTWHLHERITDTCISIQNLHQCIIGNRTSTYCIRANTHIYINVEKTTEFLHTVSGYV